MTTRHEINFDFDSACHRDIPGAILEEVETKHSNLTAGDVPGSDFLGWLDWPHQIDSDVVSRINEVASEIRDRADLFVSTGIGGSYLGARAVVEALRPFPELCDSTPEICWAGRHLSGNYHQKLLDKISDNSTYVNVISKSGTTTETALAFRLLREKLEAEYSPEEVRDRVITTTSRSSGALARAAADEGYRKFVIPGDIGGRFSVFTPVGLLPIAVAGIDIAKLLKGAGDAARAYTTSVDTARKPIRYAAARNSLYRDGVRVDLFTSFLPELSYVGDWWQQLFGESEGKQDEALYPATANFTSDLHSLGQYIQEGKPQLMETLVGVSSEATDLEVPSDPDSEDGLEYLAGRTFADVNREAEAGTVEAHLDGEVPVVNLEIPRLNAHNLGGLLYFFMFSCSLSALTLGVNPFNQPGVEAYKDNMYRRLGKPGFN